MTDQQYQEQIKRTLPEGMTKDQIIANMAMGIAGEGGEIVDSIKKYMYQGHDLNTEDIVNECGDLMWYIGNLLNVLGEDMTDCKIRNIEKLRLRYPNGFEAEKSRDRVAEIMGKQDEL